MPTLRPFKPDAEQCIKQVHRAILCTVDDGLVHMFLNPKESQINDLANPNLDICVMAYVMLDIGGTALTAKSPDDAEKQAKMKWIVTDGVGWCHAKLRTLAEGGTEGTTGYLPEELSKADIDLIIDYAQREKLL